MTIKPDESLEKEVLKIDRRLPENARNCVWISSRQGREMQLKSKNKG